MKKDNKKALYESIMTSVAKEVKKALNENEQLENVISQSCLYKYEKLLKFLNNIIFDGNSELFIKCFETKKYYPNFEIPYISFHKLKFQINEISYEDWYKRTKQYYTKLNLNNLINDLDSRILFILKVENIL